MTRLPAGVDRPPERERPDDFLVSYGESLRAARLQSGLTQVEVADRTGLQQSYIAKIEAGKRNIGIRTMKLLADVVEHDLGAFFTKFRPRHSRK
jgi:transcriptional regulator with XRE-family HTH domain